MAGSFLATKNHSGEICHLCKKAIQVGENVKFYGGPFLIHVACLDRVIAGDQNGKP